MIEVDMLTLENNKEYMIVETLLNEGNKYLFLVNKDDNEDIVVRKVIQKEDGEYIVKLDNDDEFEEIMYLFKEKHKGDNNEE